MSKILNPPFCCALNHATVVGLRQFYISAFFIFCTVDYNDSFLSNAESTSHGALILIVEVLL